MIIAKMRAFVSKFCPGICIFQFINNLWLQYTSQAYQMNCVKSLAIEKCTRNEAVLPRAALLHQSNGNEKKKENIWFLVRRTNLAACGPHILTSSQLFSPPDLPFRQ